MALECNIHYGCWPTMEHVYIHEGYQSGWMTFKLIVKSAGDRLLAALIHRDG